MSSGLVDQPLAHPVARLVGVLEEVFAEGTPACWSLTAGELVELLPRLARVRNQVAALELTLLGEADRRQVGDPVGAANTAAWWANTTHATKPAAHQAVALAGLLDADQHTPVREACAAGAVARDQAVVIVNAVEALPVELVDPELRAQAETHLVSLAAEHDARALRILGRRILAVVAPQIGEEHERRVLEAEERHAAATASFTMGPDGHGSMLGRFKIPVLAGQILAKHLNAIAAPRHQAAVNSGRAPDVEPRWLRCERSEPRNPRPLRLGQAFVEYLETRPTPGTPKAGGVAATVVVTMTMENLLGADRVATLDTGEPLSASEARRLACEAGIIPAVLGSKSQPLDLGRKTRFHTEPQRIALGLRDRGCTAQGCDWPPGMCHAHHPTPWSKGGHTSITNGILLCPRHHTLAHDNRYQLKTAKNGKVTFSRRT